eukprot:COSAG01_NODE_23606_length_808_cov_46.519041_2_plen_86_part_00
MLLYAYVQLYVYLALARYVRGTAVRIRHRVDVSSDASGNMHAPNPAERTYVYVACSGVSVIRLLDASGDLFVFAYSVHVAVSLQV